MSCLIFFPVIMTTATSILLCNFDWPSCMHNMIDAVLKVDDVEPESTGALLISELCLMSYFSVTLALAWYFCLDAEFTYEDNRCLTVIASL